MLSGGDEVDNQGMLIVKERLASTSDTMGSSSSSPNDGHEAGIGWKRAVARYPGDARRESVWRERDLHRFSDPNVDRLGHDRPVKGSALSTGPVYSFDHLPRPPLLII